MEDFRTWRDLLETLIERPRERAKLAKLVGVSAQTLQRWVTGEALPDGQQRQRLLQAVPEHALLLHTLLDEAFDESSSQDTRINRALAAFSARVFDIYASAPEEARAWSIYSAVLAEAVAQLDPQQTGLSLSVIQCMTSARQGPVRYLRATASLGTAPWPIQSDGFLGAESLAGYAVTTALPQEIQDCRPELRPMLALSEHTASALALPILHGERVAGCLLACSTQPGYFAESARLAFLQGYTALLSLAFAPDEFYPRNRIDLQPMPSVQTQAPYLSAFQQRLHATLKAAFSGSHALSYSEAQQYVWGQIAEELLQLSTTGM